VESWNERYKYYKEQINSGDVFSLFSILKDIACMSRVKKLSKSEIKVFKEILNMVSSELSLVLNYDYDETRKSILGMLGMGREFH
jgi:RNA polymerase-interacting CarD/CdnL/TRCF family regulator